MPRHCRVGPYWIKASALRAAAPAAPVTPASGVRPRRADPSRCGGEWHYSGTALLAGSHGFACFPLGMVCLAASTCRAALAAERAAIPLITAPTPATSVPTPDTTAARTCKSADPAPDGGFPTLITAGPGHRKMDRPRKEANVRKRATQSATGATRSLRTIPATG